MNVGNFKLFCYWIILITNEEYFHSRFHTRQGCCSILIHTNVRTQPHFFMSTVKNASNRHSTFSVLMVMHTWQVTSNNRVGHETVRWRWGLLRLSPPNLEEKHPNNRQSRWKLAQFSIKTKSMSQKKKANLIVNSIFRPSSTKNK